MSTATTTRPKSSLTTSEESLLAADKASFEITTDQRLKDLEESLTNVYTKLRGMTLSEGIASYLKGELGNFTWAVLVMIAGVSLAIATVSWTMRPPVPEVPKPLTQLCSSEKDSQYSRSDLIRNSLVIVKPDGTSVTMPIGSCATVVESTVHKPLTPMPQ